jgi:hypothetical protein
VWCKIWNSGEIFGKLSHSVNSHVQSLLTGTYAGKESAKIHLSVSMHLLTSKSQDCQLSVCIYLYGKPWRNEGREAFWKHHDGDME